MKIKSEFLWCVSALVIFALLGVVAMRPDIVGEAVFRVQGPQDGVDYMADLALHQNRITELIHRRWKAHGLDGSVPSTVHVRSGEPELFFKENKDMLAAIGFSDTTALAGADYDDWLVLKESVVALATTQKRRDEDLAPLLKEFARQNKLQGN